MKRTLVFMIMLLTVFICSPAYSHDFEAMKVDGEPLLIDRETGEKWVIDVGVEIYGYRVIEITKGYVTVAKPGENRVILVTKIPLQGGSHVIKVHQQ